MSETSPAEAIFFAALERPPGERAAFLDQACAGDADLRARIENMLAAQSQLGGFLDQPQAAPDPGRTGPAEPPPEAQGTVIAGRYKLLEAIGEGGMGTVWMAQQREPVKRLVAVKLIKQGMDSRAVLARFEAERQALALMDHPNIAKVLDGGTTAAGRPYFVMELVKGLPLTEYCDARRLSVGDRLVLFGQVCSAVQHAHQKGVIHRDLKPSNVLVTEHDGKPVPKVIDFGLAKALIATSVLTDKTLHTAFGAVVGTPLYMAPEQVGINALDVDTRTDIYSLGVILYELLTGSTPLGKKQLREAAWEEMRRLIREEEPPPPSTRLSTSDALPSLAANRRMEPKRLTGMVRGELDWIVMKALEKDRNRRYETANGLAMDVQRHLAGEPVMAVPPSAGYRLRKFARRHRAALTTAAAIALLLVAGVAVSTWQAVRATRAEAAARQEKARAEAGEKLARERLVQVEAEKKKADEEKAIAQAVRNFLQNKLLALAATTAQADALLKSGASSAGATLNPTIRELLDRTARELAPDKIEASFPKQPRVQAEILFTVGNTYRQIGEHHRAIDFLKRAEALLRQNLGPDHPNTLAAMNGLALAYTWASEFDLAVTLLEEALKLTKAKLGPEHPDTLITRNNLALAYCAAGKLDLALPIFEETFRLEKAKLGPDHPSTLTTMNNLASTYQAAKKMELAMPLYEESVKLHKAMLGPEHPTTLGSMNNLAYAYHVTGKINLAVPLYLETLKHLRAKLGPDHPNTLQTMLNLASAYQAAGKRDLALPLFEERFKLLRAKLGPDHPDTLRSMHNLATAHLFARRPDLAAPLFEELVKLQKAKLGPDHPNTLNSTVGLARAYRDAEKPDLAVTLLEEALKLTKAKLGPDHPTTLATVNHLALEYLAVAAKQAWSGREMELAATCQKVLLLSKDTKDAVLAERAAKICSLRPSDDKTHEAALVHARRAVELGKGHQHLAYFHMALGMAEYRRGHYAAADAELLAASKLGTKNYHVSGTAAFYRAMSLLRQGKAAEAHKLATEAVAKVKPLPADEKNPLVGNANADDLILWLAYKEAKELIRFEATPPPREKK